MPARYAAGPEPGCQAMPNAARRAVVRLGEWTGAATQRPQPEGRPRGPLRALSIPVYGLCGASRRRRFRPRQRYGRRGRWFNRYRSTTVKNETICERICKSVLALANVGDGVPVDAGIAAVRLVIELDVALRKRDSAC